MRDVKERRRSTEECALIINDLTALGERIKLLQEELAPKLTVQTTRQSHLSVRQNLKVFLSSLLRYPAWAL